MRYEYKKVKIFVSVADLTCIIFSQQLQISNDVEYYYMIIVIVCVAKGQLKSFQMLLKESTFPHLKDEHKLRSHSLFADKHKFTWICNGFDKKEAFSSNL